MADVVINFQAKNLAAPEITKLQTEIGVLKTGFDASRKEIDASKVGLIAYNTATREGATALYNFNEQLLQQNGYWRDKNGRLRDVNGKFAAVRKTVDELRRAFDDKTRPAFFALTAAITDTDAELASLKTTAVSAETIFEDSTGLVREWNKAWANSKVAVLGFKEALDGVALPDIPSVTVPDLALSGVRSPLDKIIEDMNSVTDASDALEKEVTGAGESFADLRTAVSASAPSLDTLESKFNAIEASVDDLPGGIRDFQASLASLSENAPNLMRGLFSVLSDVDDRFSGIAQTAGSIGKGDPIGFLSSIPGLQQSVQSLLAPLDESDASVQQRVALSVRRDIVGSDLSDRDKQSLLADLDNFIRELTIRYIRSLPAAFANATVAQQESSLQRQGFDFDYDRDVLALQRLGVDFQNFGELFTDTASIDVSGVIAALGGLQALAESGRAGGASPTKTRRGTSEQRVSVGSDAPVGKSGVLRGSFFSPHHRNPSATALQKPDFPLAAAPSAVQPSGVAEPADTVPLISELQRLIAIETGVAENMGSLLAEAENNTWKSAISALAAGGISINVTFAGGAARRDGVAGAGGQELFHDPQNDLLAFRAGQQAGRGTSRAFSPNATQRQNALDFSHYFGEGFASERQGRDTDTLQRQMQESVKDQRSAAAALLAAAHALKDGGARETFAHGNAADAGNGDGNTIRLELPSGVIYEIGNALVQAEADGTFVGFGSGRG